MSFPVALSSPQYTTLRGSRYDAAYYLVFGANTLVFEAEIATDATAASYAQLDYTNVTVGAYTDIEPGMTVIVSPNGVASNSRFIGRVRKTPTSSILYINEASTPLRNGYKILVYADYRYWEKLARVVGSSYFKDWDVTFHRPEPLVYGLQSAYVGIVSGSPAGYTVTFTASAVAVASGASISAYAWTIPSGGTVTGGATNTNTVTVRFDADAAEYYVKLVVTDSNGTTATRHIPVWAVPADLSTTVALGVNGFQIEASLDGGWNATVEAFAGIDTLIDNTLCAVFAVEHYSGTETVITTNVKFVGRIRKETDSNQGDQQASRVQATQFTLEGIYAQLARTAAPLIKLISKASPSVWDEVKNLTIWRGIVCTLQTHSTFLEINSLSFDSTDDSFLYPSLPTRGQNLVDVIKDFLESINGVIEFASSGEARIARDLRYVDSTARGDAVTVANFEMQDLLDFALDHEHIENVGQVKAYGGTYNGTSGAETICASYWPGTAQGPGQGREVLNRQVLVANQTKASAQFELNQRIGYKAAIGNNRDELSVTLPDGYNFVIPTASCWYTWTIASTDDARGIAFNSGIRWIVESVSQQYDPATGSLNCTAHFVKEQLSTIGRTYDPPSYPSTPPSVPSVPSAPTYPNFPDTPQIPGPIYTGPTTPQQVTIVPVDGNSLVVVGDDGRLYVTMNALVVAGIPSWVDITPDADTGFTALAFAFDTRTENAGWCAMSDGTDTVVYYSENVFAGAVTWTPSNTITGVYGLIRAASAPGSVYCYQCDNGGNWTHTFDFTTGSQQGWTPYVISSDDATWSGAGWTAGTNNPSEIGITISWAGFAVVTDIEIFMASTPSGPNCHYFYSGGDDASTANPYSFNNVSVSGSIYLGQNVDWTVGTAPNTNTLTKVILSGTGVDPFGGGGAAVAKVVYSSDFGATFGAPVSVGDIPGVFGGFDTEKIGTPTLAGADGQVYIATSAGGSYSAYGAAMPSGAQPSMIINPRYQIGSDTVVNTSTSTPQFVVGSAFLDGSNHALWKVTASGATYTSITPDDSGTPGVVVDANGFTMPVSSGKIMVGVFDFGGTRKLARSVLSGGLWVLSSAVDTSAVYVRMRNNDGLRRQVFFGNGATIGYVKNIQAASITVTSIPAPANVVAVEVYSGV